MKVLKLQPSPPENVIKALEEHLEAAKAGNLRAFCLVYENPLGGTGYHVALGEGAKPEALIARLHMCSIELACRQLASEQDAQGEDPR